MMTASEVPNPSKLPSSSGAVDTSLSAFFKAVQNNNLEAVKGCIQAKPDIVRERHPNSGETALHVAATLGHVGIVEELVSKMEEEDLAIEENGEMTALELAAIHVTDIRIAKCMVEKNKKILSHGPLVAALGYGNENMAYYLYRVTPLEELLPEKGTHGADVLNLSINMQCYATALLLTLPSTDIAFDLLDRCPALASTLDDFGNTTILASTYIDSSRFPSGTRLKFWQQWIYDYISIQIQENGHAKSDICIDVRILESSQDEESYNIRAGTFRQRLASFLLDILGIKSIYEMKLCHHYTLGIVDRLSQVIQNLDDEQINKVSVNKALHFAAARGLVEIFVGIAKANPVIVRRPEVNDVFLEAVKNRQPTIVSLLHGISSNQIMKAKVYNSCETILHMAGYLAPYEQLSKIPGAALQMQSEIQWYKEVEKIALPHHLYYVSRNGHTPWGLFTKEHKDLMNAGEKWMKDTASSCSLVGSLIATIMFAAAFTVPGGNNQDTGFPIFLGKKLFKIFITTDAISLFSSTTSVLTFMGILTSRYAEEDFLTSLPTKLIIGLFTLFLSIVTMTIAFCAALLIVFHKDNGFVITILCLASLPLTLFGWMQFPLLIQVFKATYGPSIFDRKVKPWL